jgi:hypothetical protein
MNQPQECASCSVRGYSTEFCTLHRKFLHEKGYSWMRAWWSSGWKKPSLGKTLAIGACAGLLTSVAGVSAAAAFGVKSLADSLIMAKLVAGGGVAGAMTSVAIDSEGREDLKNTAKKRRHFIPPLLVKEKDNHG